MTGDVIYQFNPPTTDCRQCVRCGGWIVGGLIQYFVGQRGTEGPFCQKCFAAQVQSIVVPQRVKEPRAAD